MNRPEDELRESCTTRSTASSRARARHDPCPHREQHPGNGRAWLLGAFGAAVATAAVVAGVAVLRRPRPTAAPRSGRNADGPGSPHRESLRDAVRCPLGRPLGGRLDGSSGGTGRAGVLRRGLPQGVSLYREFQRVDARDHLLTAADLPSAATPVDPDYRSLWPDGASIDTVPSDGVGADAVIQVGLSDLATLRDRPPTMSEREAQLAVQQVVYTVQGTVQERRAGAVPARRQGHGHRAGCPHRGSRRAATRRSTCSPTSTSPARAGRDGTRELVVTGVASSLRRHRSR